MKKDFEYFLNDKFYFKKAIQRQKKKNYFEKWKKKTKKQHWK